MPRPSLGLSKINFFCDPTVVKGLKWLAQSRGTTYSELLRSASKEFVLREIRKEQSDLITLSSVDPEPTAADG